MRYNKAIITHSGKLQSKEAPSQLPPAASSAENNSAASAEEPNTAAQKLRKGRGKASGDLKLSPELLAVNKIMQEKFILLRQSIFAPEECTRQERIRQQRQTLAATLGVHEKLIRAIEKTPSTLPATVIFALIKRYNLSADYFMLRGSALSEQFILEQKMSEFEYKLTHREALAQSSERFSNKANQPEAQRRGGWLKGLPRKAKTASDAYLLALWNEVKLRNYSPDTVEDMLQWAKDNSVKVDIKDVPVQSDEKTDSKHESRRRGRAAAQRHGGWLLGLSRKPSTEEQKEQMRIWRIAKAHNHRFNSVKEMMAWWIVEGQQLTD
ncbi:MAG: hypothetical protein Q4F00_12185 [bacterium]|nr:hypothetical protein [bacterium]